MSNFKITKNIDLYDFQAWAGAVDTLDKIKEEDKVRDLHYLLEELYPEGVSETHVNDLLWHDWEFIYKCLNIRDDE
jgi:hypothetical protein